MLRLIVFRGAHKNVAHLQTHVYSLYIGSLCNIAFPMTRFTCIVTSQVIVKI